MNRVPSKTSAAAPIHSFRASLTGSPLSYPLELIPRPQSTLSPARCLSDVGKGQKAGHHVKTTKHVPVTEVATSSDADLEQIGAASNTHRSLTPSLHKYCKFIRDITGNKATGSANIENPLCKFIPTCTAPQKVEETHILPNQNRNGTEKTTAQSASRKQRKRSALRKFKKKKGAAQTRNRLSAKIRPSSNKNERSSDPGKGLRDHEDKGPRYAQTLVYCTLPVETQQKTCDAAIHQGMPSKSNTALHKECDGLIYSSLQNCKGEVNGTKPPTQKMQGNRNSEHVESHQSEHFGLQNQGNKETSVPRTCQTSGECKNTVVRRRREAGSSMQNCLTE